MCQSMFEALRYGTAGHRAMAANGLHYAVRGLRRQIRRLVRDESGATAIEYGLIIGGISIAILATVFAIGDQLDNIFTLAETRMHSRFSTM